MCEINMLPNFLCCNPYLMIVSQKKKGSMGNKRKGGPYDTRKDETLVGKYKRGAATRFVAYHCKKAFEEGSACVDAVCMKCRFAEGSEGHSCTECKESISDYHEMIDQSYMPRNRKNWPGPGPVFCGICEIRL